MVRVPLKGCYMQPFLLHLDMDIKRQNISVIYLNDENILVSLKWLRGASRYNNGATIYGRKYLLRLLLGRVKQKKDFEPFIERTEAKKVTP